MLAHQGNCPVGNDKGSYIHGYNPNKDRNRRKTTAKIEFRITGYKYWCATKHKLEIRTSSILDIIALHYMILLQTCNTNMCEYIYIYIICVCVYVYMYMHIFTSKYVANFPSHNTSSTSMPPSDKPKRGVQRPQRKRGKVMMIRWINMMVTGSWIHMICRLGWWFPGMGLPQNLDCF